MTGETTLPNQIPRGESVQDSRPWSNRILILSLAGILSLTLFPFRLDLHAHLAGRSPFLLGGGLKYDGMLHIVLNVLLFAPLGFALSMAGDRRGAARWRIFLWNLIACLLLSYAIEFLQIYIPSRDSAWDDVCSNTLGGVIGCLLYLLCGRAVVSLLMRCEQKVQARLSVGLGVALFAVYLAGWLAISIPLQEKTRLVNWDPNAYLILGNSASEESPWSGRILALKIWDHGIAADIARRLTSPSKSTSSANPVPIAAFDFSGTPPFLDQKGTVPEMQLISRLTRDPDTNARVSTKTIQSERPASQLVWALRKTNQFSIRLDYIPNGTAAQGRILSLESLTGVTDMSVYQDGTDLLLFVENNLARSRNRLALRVPNVFSGGRESLILVSYDGSGATLFTNGERLPGSYYFGPGAGLVRYFIRLKWTELVGYLVFYDAIVFAPLGVLLGLIIRLERAHGFWHSLGVPALIILPPILFEVLIAHVSGRAFSTPMTLPALFMIITGFIWINCDRSSPAQSP
jgi:hypothetical protein